MFTKTKLKAIIWGLPIFLLSLIVGCSKSGPALAPVASFTWTASSLTAPSAVTFNNKSTNSSSYLWDFGDGGTSTAYIPTHTYTAGGTYTVKLTVTGQGGTNSTTQTVNLANPTALQITIKDNLGNPVTGATVKLYSSTNDWTNETNQLLTTQTSNANGVVTFSPLSSILYYWKVTSGCQNNFFGSNTTANALTANVTNTVTTVLGGTGTLAFSNTSTNPYDVYVNGTVQITNMAGGTTKNLIVPVGAYTIRVLQKSGYLISPTDKTYNGTLSCGLTLTTTFP